MSFQRSDILPTRGRYAVTIRQHSHAGDPVHYDQSRRAHRRDPRVTTPLDAQTTVRQTAALPRPLALLWYGEPAQRHGCAVVVRTG